MSATIHLEVEGAFAGMSTADMVQAAVALLNNGDVVLGDGDQDYAAADLLEVLGVMHHDTGIDLELLPQVRAFAYVILNGRWTA